jgi:hypothetical protein
MPLHHTNPLYYFQTLPFLQAELEALSTKLGYSASTTAGKKPVVLQSHVVEVRAFGERLIREGILKEPSLLKEALATGAGDPTTYLINCYNVGPPTLTSIAGGFGQQQQWKASPEGSVSHYTTSLLNLYQRLVSARDTRVCDNWIQRHPLQHAQQMHQLQKMKMQENIDIQREKDLIHARYSEEERREIAWLRRKEVIKAKVVEAKEKAEIEREALRRLAFLEREKKIQQKMEELRSSPSGRS